MATYFVRPTNGSDAADGLTFANAFQTFQKALDTAASAGDIIRLCPESVETTSVQIDVDINTGTSLAPIIIEPGNTSDGSRDISLFYTIQASSSMTSLLSFGTGQDFYQIFNLIVDANATATSAFNNPADGSDFNQFVNCRFTDATSHGVQVKGTGTFNWQFYNCEVDNNGGVGIFTPTANRGSLLIHGGSTHDNGDDGVDIRRLGGIYHLASYDNAGSGIRFGAGNSDQIDIHYCNMFGNDGDGWEHLGSTAAIGARMANNTASGNGGYGFNFNGAADTDVVEFMDYNHTFNNTSGISDLTLPGDNNQTGDPLFTSIVDGSEDFTPKTGSPLSRNSLSGSTIGPVETEAGAGGGGIAQIVGSGGIVG